ncbi:MAG: TonB-dependent receptor [Bacteroidales bacterium]|nr:TonB-dependent receptor [Bacteroidales bacterium]
MIKKYLLSISALILSVAMSAQNPTGGVKGVVVDRSSKTALDGAVLKLYSGTQEIATVRTGADGSFYIPDLKDGMYDLVIENSNYLQSKVNVTVNDGYVKNMFKLSLTPVHKVGEVDDASFTEFDLDDSGYQDSPTILFGQNDVFNNIAGYNFSSVRFRVRGYSSESQDVYMAGVRMNDAITGYTPYSLWSGLNEAVRSKESVNGSEISDYGFGGYNGLTNIDPMASKVRTGWRGSVLTNSALYRLRLMMTYSSGELDNGWSYAFSASARLGGNDWIKGVYYRSFGYYGSVEKKFGEEHKLGLTFMAAPGQRGAQNGSTQEVYDLMGDNMYNSNWGYYNGKVRNARVKKTHEPIAILKYDFTPESKKLKASATVLYRFGKNGYTALDWYDAPDPRPDYYRNLPSYFFMDNTDYNRLNYSKYMWAKEQWEQDIPSITHINWDRLYAVNAMNSTADGNRSKYVIEERRTDQQDLNFAANAKWSPVNCFTLAGGLSYKWNRTEYYKILDDLLGGDYYVNIDQFAERDYASSVTMYQNDLDYYLKNGKAQTLKQGDKYGYDYYANVRRAEAWVSGKFSKFGLDVALAGRIGYTKYWREGLLRKGLFPGLDANGQPMTYEGKVITTYDPITGDAITSLGKSEVKDFLTGAAKLNVSYVIPGGHRVYANAAFIADAPNFNQAFISPRTRNSIVPNLKTNKTLTADLNYAYSNSGYDVRVTGYYTAIKDQSKVMSFYDDAQNSFANFAMSGIDQRHIGLELGFKVPLPVPNLALQGVVSYGQFVYTSNPKMYQTYDNSAAIVEDTYGVTIPYWKSHPTADGKTVKHYVSGTPQLATSLGLSWNKNYWFVDADVDYFDFAYLDMNPLYRTDMATSGPDKTVTPTEIEYMAAQEKFKGAVLVNASVGKSWYIKRNYQLGFSLQVKNILNTTNLRTGGYEQTRLVDNTVSKERYYRFDSKYFYMSGINYMLNIYFRF